MFSTIKKVIIILVILTAIALTAIYFYSYDRTYFNSEDETGNTAGNIYNGGLFCERNGRIYFSNDNDDGSLYVMNSDSSGISKVNDDKAAYINADDNYIYYVRANNTRENNSGGFMAFKNTGIYRVNKNGKNFKMISGNPGSYLTLQGNFLYYQDYDANTGLYLYRSRIDSKLQRLLINDSVIPAAVINNKLYYAGYSKDHNINTLDLSSFTTNKVTQGNFVYPIVSGNYIYYIDMSDNYKIKRMNLDGSDPVTLVKERTCAYNITVTGKYLYYQVDNLEKSKICRLNLDTNKSETLLEGYYKQIHVTENYVFFKDFDNTKTYVVSADGNPKVKTFNPPDLSKK